ATGLSVRSAKMSVELHPPIDEDKGTVLHRLAGFHTGPVLFAGDDVGDTPAFDALGGLAAAGRPVLAIVVDGPEVPSTLRRRADLLVDGPAEVADIVLSLAG
ncbi:MAG: trehalose-phosphatase, partial [Microthrixaceae bacterium]|nr:trehalose-phosphatase [Microthrixaceae bacterium]